MSDPPPNELDTLKARLRDRESVAGVNTLIQVCLDVLGVSRDPEVQAQGVLARLGAHDKELADMKLTYLRLERYGRVCAAAGIVVIAWVALSAYALWRNELSSAEPPRPAPLASQVIP